MERVTMRCIAGEKPSPKHLALVEGDLSQCVLGEQAKGLHAREPWTIKDPQTYIFFT